VNFSLIAVWAFQGVALAYLVLLESGMSLLAALVLSCGVSLVESGSMALTVRVYNNGVVKPRAQHPGAVHGNQRWLAVVLPALNHGWAEATRMATVLAGTAKDPHDLGWAFSLFLTLLLNVLHRCGWSFWLSSLFTKVCVPDMQYNCAVRLMNVDARKYCGYPRFALVIALMLARLIIYQELDPSKPRCAFFNLMTLAVLVSMIVFEIIEDVIVHSKLVKQPYFTPKWFEKAHTSMGNDNIMQMVALTKTPGQDGEWTIAKQADGANPCCAFSLHGVQPVSTTLSVFTFFIIANFTLHTLEVLFGDGFLFGVCPTSGLTISQKVLGFFVVDTPFACN